METQGCRGAPAVEWGRRRVPGGGTWAGNPGVQRGAGCRTGAKETPRREHLGWILRTNRRWAKKNIKGRGGDLPLINEREMTRLLQETVNISEWMK